MKGTAREVRHRKALALLKDPAGHPGLPRCHGTTLLRVWRYPAFQSWHSWCVIRTSGGAVLRRVAWAQTKGELLPDPITYCSEASLPESVLVPLMTRLEGLSVRPFLPEPEVPMAVCDGCEVGLRAPRYIADVEFSYEEESLPEPWREVGRWVEDALRQFDLLLPPSAADNP